MNKRPRTVLLVLIGLLLCLNGAANIIDDARVLTYDLTSILAGIGFLVLGWTK
jgi:hypothetical protein